MDSGLLCLRPQDVLQLSELHSSDGSEFSLEDNRTPSEICGLDSRFDEWLASLGEQIKLSTDKDWFCRFLEHNAQTAVAGSTETMLKSYGYTEKKSAEIAEWLKTCVGEFEMHSSLLEWSKRYIYDQILSGENLGKQVANYPFEEGSTSSWFQLPVTMTNAANEQQNVNVNGINVNGGGDMSFTTREGEPYPPDNNEDFFYLYHGTSHFSARNIVLHGIDLAYCGRANDFSCGRKPGFYFSTTFDPAYQWAHRVCNHGTTRPAVLVFKVPKVEFATFYTMWLEDDSKDWKEIILLNRTQWRERISVPLFNDFKNNAKCVHGNMCANPRDISRNVEPCTHGVPKKQFAVLSNSMCRFFCLNIDAAIFFPGGH